jgi:hypothetical protein
MIAIFMLANNTNISPELETIGAAGRSAASIDFVQGSLIEADIEQWCD